MKKAERICPGENPAARRFLKRMVSRLRRRDWKKKGEDAAGKRRDYTRGYSL